MKFSLLTETPRPFDFLINGEFLRVSLEKYIELTGTSTVCPRAMGTIVLMSAGRDSSH